MARDIYAVLAECEGFQWDDGNAKKVRARHQVEPPECEQVFMEWPLLVVADVGHSTHEDRWRVLGKTAEYRPLFLVFTVRAALIRVLQARPMNRKERRIYAKAESNA